MATMPNPSPDSGQGAAPQGSGTPAPGASPSTPPSQQQASAFQKLLADWANVAKQIAAAEPRTASGMEKVSQGIQEALTALVTPPQQTPIGQQPSY